MSSVISVLETAIVAADEASLQDRTGQKICRTGNQGIKYWLGFGHWDIFGTGAAFNILFCYADLFVFQ